MILISRLKSFTERLSWYQHFVPSPVHAFYHLILMKLKPGKLVKAKYKGQPFLFSVKDMSAVREVLFDEEYKFLKPILSGVDQPSILDIGANIGTFSLWVFAINERAQILSVEASPKTYKTLLRNNALKKNTHGQWSCQNAAAWRDDTSVNFSEQGDSMGFKVKDNGTVKVNAVSLTFLINECLKTSKSGFVEIMKVDIEGAEEAFLEPLQKNKEALKKVKNLIIELHPNYCNAAPVEAFLRECFVSVKEQQDRESRKPLLLCQN